MNDDEGTQGGKMPTNVKPIPEGMHTVTPSLVLAGCAKAIDFYKEAFGAEEIDRYVAPDGKSIWHAALRIGDSVVFVADEMQGMSPPAPGAGRPSPVRMWLYVPDCDAAFERAVAGGAKARRRPEDMFWGDRTGAVSDPFGYEWEFATRVKNLTPEEMRRAGQEFARKMAAGQ
jgi:PhnB protein